MGFFLFGFDPQLLRRAQFRCRGGGFLEERNAEGGEFNARVEGIGPPFGRIEIHRNEARGAAFLRLLVEPRGRVVRFADIDGRSGADAVAGVVEDREEQRDEFRRERELAFLGPPSREKGEDGSLSDAMLEEGGLFSVEGGEDARAFAERCFAEGEVAVFPKPDLREVADLGAGEGLEHGMVEIEIGEEGKVIDVRLGEFPVIATGEGGEGFTGCVGRGQGEDKAAFLGKLTKGRSVGGIPWSGCDDDLGVIGIESLDRFRTAHEGLQGWSRLEGSAQIKER